MECEEIVVGKGAGSVPSLRKAVRGKRDTGCIFLCEFSSATMHMCVLGTYGIRISCDERMVCKDSDGVVAVCPIHCDHNVHNGRERCSWLF